MDNGDMILVYKIFHGFLEGVQWRGFFQMADTSEKVRSAKVYLQTKDSEYVEWPARRRCYGFIGEGVQNQARGLL